MEDIMRKKILYGVMCVALSAAIAGCGSKGNNNETVKNVESDAVDESAGTSDISSMDYDTAKEYLAGLPETDASCFEYTTVDVPDGECAITSYTGDNTVVVVPEVIDGLTVTTVGSYCFSNNNDIEAVRLPLTLTAVDIYGFGICKNLKFVTGVGNVESLGKCSFLTGSDLYIEFTDSVTSVAEEQIFSPEVHLRLKKDSYLANVEGHLWYSAEEMDVTYY
jgi:hypothetical protein